MKFNFKNYQKVLEILKKNDYDFIPAYDWKKFKHTKKKIILRHDIDFETNYAYKIGILEKKNNIISNFFFLMKDDVYDLYSEETEFCINKLKEMGHSIGVHFNIKYYKNKSNFKKKIINDIKFFLKYYSIKKLIISEHQPRLNNYKKFEIKSEFNSYNNQVMKYFNYYSDSSMKLDFQKLQAEIENKNNIQFLTHPIWWVTRSNNLVSKVNQSKKIKIKKINLIYDKYLGIAKKFHY